MVTVQDKLKNPKYYCKQCAFHTKHKQSYIRHLQTKKHLNESLFKALCSKRFKYKSGRSRHHKTCAECIAISAISTPIKNSVSMNCKYFGENVSILPKLVTIDSDNNHKPTKVSLLGDSDKKYDCACGKIYKHRQSLYNHRKKCSINMETEINPQNNDFDKLTSQVSVLIKENQEMRKCIFEIMPNMGNTIINNTNNTNNNHFNMNVFLNEHCKGAQNLTDFIKTIVPCLEDLQKTKNHGYITGISNIFIKNLKQLDTHERPIHCSDFKRQTMYIKDFGTWEVDDERKNIKQALREVAKKQIGGIKKWEELHPNWKQSESQTQEYMDLIRNLTDAGDKPEEEEQTSNKIIKSISKEVIIDKT
jgi:hypothetical protein